MKYKFFKEHSPHSGPQDHSTEGRDSSTIGALLIEDHRTTA